MTPARPEDVSTLPAALAARAAATPEDPWLFYPVDLDWHWRSYAQVADQVARGASALAERTPERRIDFPDHLEPDTVATALAIQAAGHTAVPRSPGNEAGNVVPKVRSRLERFTPHRLDSRATAGMIAFEHGSDSLRHDHLLTWARELDALLPAPRARRIVLLDARLRATSRWAFLAWTLASGAAFILEDDPDLFVATALSLRPTVAIAPGASLDRLADALAPRRYRRWHRFEAVVGTDRTAGSKPWEDLGAVIRRPPRLGDAAKISPQCGETR